MDVRSRSDGRIRAVRSLQAARRRPARVVHRGVAEVPVGAGEFAKRFRVRTDHRALAHTIMTAEAQRALATRPRRIALRLEGGAVAVEWSAKPRPDEGAELVRRPDSALGVYDMMHAAM